MKSMFCNLSLVLALSLCGCTASEKTQLNDLGKDSSNSLKTLGKDVVKVGQAIKSSTKDAGTDNDKGAKDAKVGNDSKPSNNLEKSAANAIGELRNQGDKSEHALASAIKGLGKNIDAAPKSDKGTNKPASRSTKLDHN